ncbi:hypothetical protein [Streptomyces alkaliterrae]|uniref:Uncharacterized protein n=1 Tax=Streptomyces alkaliterrae TaxID=2213162 RepID=A0A7W3WIC7_9ACTN|nr:hypothetical protein [Streptomyces alkaliterrae]MBB1252725.1 hypothetical protein [Streptomyces alkaliterrae]MBB1259506.1 hypothetical protein [Streptomyces alkaliterrae]
MSVPVTEHKSPRAPAEPRAHRAVRLDSPDRDRPAPGLAGDGEEHDNEPHIWRGID